MQKKIESSFKLQDQFLESCDKKPAKTKLEPFTLIIFGGAGDLSKRKLLPSLYHLFLDKQIEDFTVLGIGRTQTTDQEFRTLINSSLKKFSAGHFDNNTANSFIRHLHYLYGDSFMEELYQKLHYFLDQIDEKRRINLIYYLAVPPQILPQIVQGLGNRHVVEYKNNSKIIIEKPFGQDQKTSAELNQLLLKVFRENQIYRIDHYLGKETVQNILFFRFGNSIFEPLWNRRYIDHVQIMVAEDLGIEKRGLFYEQAGIVRDIVQNHILHLLALVAMEPPAGFDADLIRNEKVKVYRSIRPFNEKQINQVAVRGQYGPGNINHKKVSGYREEKQVARDSNTSTFFAGRFHIDNWRWAGVPFYIRTGKRLPQRLSEIYVEFKHPPLKLFGRTCDMIKPNGLVLSIQPEEEIIMQLSVKVPGIQNKPQTVNMTFNYEKSFQVKPPNAYERLIIDCIKGDLTLFARHDGIEAMWEIVDPINRYWDTHPAKDFPNYAAGTWGSDGAFKLIEKDSRRWRFDGKEGS